MHDTQANFKQQVVEDIQKNKMRQNLASAKYSVGVLKKCNYIAQTAKQPFAKRKRLFSRV